MKTVKWIIIIVAVLLGLFIAVTAFLPKDYHVERSVVISAPAVLVYSQVVDLEAWQAWNPWSEMDPEMTIEYGENTVGKGAWYAWTSNVAGNGRMTIIETSAPNTVRYELVFQGYDELPSYSSMILEADDPLSPTRVTWTFEGDVGDQFFARWMAVAMDKFVGESYQQGLKALKKRCEGMADKVPPAL
ncbi:MAG: SRPBCC family protein [Oceanipulchritudo sp.]